MQKKIIISLLLLLLISFFLLFPINDSMEDSKGTFNEIVIVSSLEDKAILEPIIDEYIFLDTIYTPEPETRYKKTWIKPEDFSHYKKYSNIFILSLNDPPDQSLDPVVKEFKKRNQIQKFPAIARNVYSKPQIITFIQNSNNLELRTNLDTIGLTINNLVSKHVDSLYMYRYNKLEKNLEISNLSSKIFMNKKLFIDNNFKIINYNESDDKYLWIGKGSVGMSNSSYQWLIIKECDSFSINGNIELLDIVNKELNKINKDIEIVSNNTKFYKTSLRSLNLYKIYANYNHNSQKVGGPIIIYLLEDSINNKNTIFYGLVSAPGQNKLKYIKELEIIIINFIF